MERNGHPVPEELEGRVGGREPGPGAGTGRGRCGHHLAAGDGGGGSKTGGGAARLHRALCDNHVGLDRDD